MEYIDRTTARVSQVDDGAQRIESPYNTASQRGRQVAIALDSQSIKGVSSGSTILPTLNRFRSVLLV